MPTENWINKPHIGDCREIMRSMVADGVKVQCAITSPPYWGLRDYGIEGQLGMEETPETYVNNMVEVFRLVRELLAEDGVCFINLGDSYYGIHSMGNCAPKAMGIQKRLSECYGQANKRKWDKRSDIKPKDLVGIPWSVAFALRADGWYLRSDIIWCLSGGTYVYAKTQKGEMTMPIRDMARLNPSTVKLWNGKKWTQLLGISKSKRQGSEIEIVLRSGERISCTPTHKFPTNKGLLEASQIKKGDKIEICQLPNTNTPKDCFIDEDAAWLAGLYMAEGSRSGDCIQIAGHSKERKRLISLSAIAKKYGGYITHTEKGNNLNIRLYGKILNALIDELVSGKTAKDKCFNSVVWRYSNKFIQSMLEGYLSGDGHWDSKNQRWRLGFMRNYNLERDIRIACSRLGWHLVLNLSSVKYNGKLRPTFRGEIRINRGGHFNQKQNNEVVEIRKARCREVYDIGVADEPHLFALASGILTHNSKPNPMPESVKDRPTKSHEYIFLLSKNANYYYDAEAIKENSVDPESINGRRKRNPTTIRKFADENKIAMMAHNHHSIPEGKKYEKRNKRSVWIVNTQPYKEAHFATFPPALIMPCILAGSRVGDTILDPFFGSGTTGEVAEKLGRKWIGIDLNPEYETLQKKRTLQMGLGL